MKNRKQILVFNTWQSNYSLYLGNPSTVALMKAERQPKEPRRTDASPPQRAGLRSPRQRYASAPPQAGLSAPPQEKARMIFDNRSQTAIQAQLIQSIQKKENRVGLSDNGSKPIQKITVVNVTDDFHLAFRHINTLAGLNEVLEAHLIPILTPHSIFYRLRYPGREPEGNNRYTREDGVVLDEYVQLRIGDLTNGGLIPSLFIGVYKSKLMQPYHPKTDSGCDRSGGQWLSFGGKCRGSFH